MHSNLVKTVHVMYAKSLLGNKICQTEGGLYVHLVSPSFFTQLNRQIYK